MHSKIISRFVRDLNLWYEKNSYRYCVWILKKKQATYEENYDENLMTFYNWSSKQPNVDINARHQLYMRLALFYFSKNFHTLQIFKYIIPYIIPGNLPRYQCNGERSSTSSTRLSPVHRVHRWPDCFVAANPRLSPLCVCVCVCVCVCQLTDSPYIIVAVEWFWSVISFGTIKEPTTLIPDERPRGRQGIRFRHKATTLWLFDVRFADGFTLWKTTGLEGRGNREAEEDDDEEEKEDDSRRTTKRSSHAGFATWTLAPSESFLSCNGWRDTNGNIIRRFSLARGKHLL